MRPIGIVGIALTCGALGFVVGARRQPEVDPPSAQSRRLGSTQAVVTWDGGSLTVDEVSAALDQFGPQGRERYRDEKLRRQFVAELARSAILASEARRLGLDKTPEVVLRQRQELAAQFVKTHFEATLKADPTEAELKQWYDAHRESYSQPEAIRIAQVLLLAPVTDSALRGRRRAEAAALLADVQKKSALDFYAFSNLAHAKSDDIASRTSGGELPPMSTAQLKDQFGPALEGAISKMAPGSIFPRLAETDRGYHLIRLLEVRSATEAPFSQVRESIAQQLRAERKGQAWQKFVADLEHATGLTIDEAALRELK